MSNSAGETPQEETYRIDVATGKGDTATVDVQGTNPNEALSSAAGFSAWEIGANGKFHNGFEHFTVFAEDLDSAEEKLLDNESDAHSIIDNSQFKLGDVTRVELRGERGL